MDDQDDEIHRPHVKELVNFVFGDDELPQHVSETTVLPYKSKIIEWIRTNSIALTMEDWDAKVLEHVEKIYLGISTHSIGINELTELKAQLHEQSMKNEKAKNTLINKWRSQASASGDNSVLESKIGQLNVWAQEKNKSFEKKVDEKILFLKNLDAKITAEIVGLVDTLRGPVDPEMEALVNELEQQFDSMHLGTPEKPLEMTLQSLTHQRCAALPDGEAKKSLMADLEAASEPTIEAFTARINYCCWVHI